MLTEKLTKTHDGHRRHRGYPRLGPRNSARHSDRTAMAGTVAGWAAWLPR